MSLFKTQKILDVKLFISETSSQLNYKFFKN